MLLCESVHNIIYIWLMLFCQAVVGDGDGAAAARRTCPAMIGASRQTCDGDGSDSDCVFIDASAAAVAAVDFCSMSSVVEDDDLFEEPEDEELAHVYVPGVCTYKRCCLFFFLADVPACH